jgi:hypothetical protein
MEISKMLNDELVIPPIGFVYAIRCNAYPNKIEIGQTDDLKKKLSQLNVRRAPFKHTLVAFAESFDTKRDETIIHRYFAKSRKEGNFFEISPKQVKDYFDISITAVHNNEMRDYKYPDQNWFGNDDEVEVRVKVPKRRKLSIIETFVLEFANEHHDQKEYKLLANEFYEKYQLFAEARQIKQIETRTQFGIDVKCIEGVGSKRMSDGVRYTLDLDEIKEYFEG